MKILVTGGRGMLGRTLCRVLGDHEVISFTRSMGDITDGDALKDFFEAQRPDCVVHAAAMTAVDDCETKTGEAMRINGGGSANVAQAAALISARLIAISTDYVFDGTLDRPYREDDEPAPRTAYGRSKLAGEQAILRFCPDAAILRTAWLYGKGGPSFVHTMMRLGREEGPPVRVVNDQVGNPTSTDALAGLIEQFLERHESGIFHASCEGEATWYDVASEIFTLKHCTRSVVPCSSSEYPRPAQRPSNSRLEKRALRLKGYRPLPHWREALVEFLERYPDG
ncbi:MAG: dTDP-4-dehydrorhamnose reductase [Syntrophales bacterium]|nr:dTDP-4-dehydrorhamnose reductase [Syntrophales bacterium]MDX9922907.1 dTDP-4-dehydrorhamnose reductase [Syntrophales bacterium]